MHIGIIGAGNIGGNIARRLAAAGHTLTISFARNADTLETLAAEIGPMATAGSPAEAASADVVVLSVPWGVIDEALDAAGSLSGRVVIDTTNQFGPGGPIDLGGVTAARHNADRMNGARYTKSFNTLTARFQADAADRVGDERVVQWIAGDDADATRIVADLVTDAGYRAVELAGIDGCSVMEAPRRPGAVYGEEYRTADTAAVVAAVRAGEPIPATPTYRPTH